MRTILLASLGAATILVAACSSDGDRDGDGGSATSSSSTSSAGGAPAVDIDSFTESVAASICGALARCCDAQSTTDYFASYAQSTLLATFVTQIPPQHAFADAKECAATLKQMLDITPFGDWVAAVKAGRVTFEPAAFAVCKETLDGAACGAEVGMALTDGTCFGFLPPPGGALQRSAFHRTGKTGDPCAPIRDGVGAGFFGDCDPTGYFCCYADPQKPGVCALPFDANGAPRAGTCKAASQAGEVCAVFGSVQICATGLSCDSTSDHCVADSDAPLAVGATCVDAGFNLLGICQDSWCDILGSAKCEPLKADGSQCGGGDECQSTACVKGQCGAPTFCTGP